MRVTRVGHLWMVMVCKHVRYYKVRPTLRMLRSTARRHARLVRV